MLLYWPALLIGRLARVLIRLVRKGGGSALPGLILSKIAPGILWRVLDGFSGGLVIVTGSAGKSTTTKMLVAIAREHGLSVFTNPSTANILQGFYSTIIEKSSLSGRISADIAILEMDEAHAESLTTKVAPRQVTVMNVMEDQLDRFVDPAFVRDELAKVAGRATESVILNADDQNTIIIGEGLTGNLVSWFGINPTIITTNGRRGVVAELDSGSTTTPVRCFSTPGCFSTTSATNSEISRTVIPLNTKSARQPITLSSADPTIPAIIRANTGLVLATAKAVDRRRT